MKISLELRMNLQDSRYLPTYVMHEYLQFNGYVAFNI
jgi:hypothetical protein